MPRTAQISRAYFYHVILCTHIWLLFHAAPHARVEERNDDGPAYNARPRPCPRAEDRKMALRARYGPGNRAWSYQRPAEDAGDGAPPLPSAFGLTLSADEHTPVPESRIDADAPTQTAADAARNANGSAKARAKNDGASAARAARAAKASAARSARASAGAQSAISVAAASIDTDFAPRRRSGRVPATTAKARGLSPTHTTAPQRTVKRKRSTLAPDVVHGPDADPEAALQPLEDATLPLAGDENPPAEQTPAPIRAPRTSGVKRPRVSQKGEENAGIEVADLDLKPLRGDEGDDGRRTTFGSTTSAPDPFTALSVADLVPSQDQAAHEQVDPTAANPENRHGANFRRLPPGVPVHRYLSGLYRRYPVSQVGLPKEVLAEVPDLDTSVALPPTTIPNATPFLNLYAPRRTRGIGADKHGLCPICAEPPSRGGRGKVMMLNMKLYNALYSTNVQLSPNVVQSPVVRHSNIVHVTSPFTPCPIRRAYTIRTDLVAMQTIICSLSPKTGLPFSPPMAFRSTPRKTVGAREKAALEEGLCHACQRWIVIEGVKAVEVLVPEIYWWKHASTCHKSRMLDGEGDFYVEDALFKRIVQWQRDHPAATTRASTTTGTVPKKEEPMDIDLQAPTVTSSRTGAMTPIRPNADEPDSSPLSSLDGTDATRISPAGRKASAPALHYTPTSRGPFGPPSPSARAKSADPSIPPPPPGVPLTANHINTPQLANHALPGTLPGTPQTTASATPVMPVGALPTVPMETTDTEARSVVDSGVALSPHDPSKSIDDGMDGDAEAEGEDEDAEGEDDPTATAESTPVIPQLPVLTPLPTVPVAEAEPVRSAVGETTLPVAAAEDSLTSSAPQEQAPVVQQDAGGQEPLVNIPQPTSLGLDTTINLPNSIQSSGEQAGAQQESSSVPTLGTEPQPIVTEPQVQVPEDVHMADASITPADAPKPNPTPIPELQTAIPAPVEVQPIPENIPPAVPQQEVDSTPAPVPAPASEPAPAPTATTSQDTSVPQASALTESSSVDEMAIPAVPAELPAVQEMDMYTNTATPNEQETAPLLTETDLALANTDLALAVGDIGLVSGLGGAEMSLVGEETAIPGGGLEIPTENLQPLATPVPSEPALAVQEAVNNAPNRPDTPNGGGDDMFAFWNA
ncbi:hypothetical protein RHS04_07166 [Rhizoctonia solani]|uniref:Transcription regulator Rua1 C-terminal domain-containing protein n=1 Tax=Rhizoctonia solani TaxID=456999 RepID=A0A8H7H4N1_9AGAM|nr:hypothetical protein RHS04_07166 [Rhizoctonia solani]